MEALKALLTKAKCWCEDWKLTKTWTICLANLLKINCRSLLNNDSEPANHLSKCSHCGVFSVLFQDNQFCKNTPPNCEMRYSAEQNYGFWKIGRKVLALCCFVDGVLELMPSLLNRFPNSCKWGAELDYHHHGRAGVVNCHDSISTSKCIIVQVFWIITKVVGKWTKEM